MGREASCHCRWGTEEANVMALLETHALILRGGMRRKVALSSIHDLSVNEESLTFRVDSDRVELALGKQAAGRWAKAIAEPPSLASKLGILNGRRVKVLGQVDDDALAEALSHSIPAQNSEAEMIFILARTPQQLEDFWSECEVERSSGASIWVVYPKGKGKALTEAHLRTTLRAQGMVDTKIASVSETLTALHFSRRKAESRSRQANG